MIDSWRPFGRASRTLAISKAAMSQSNIARLMAASTDCRHWPPSWWPTPWPLSLRSPRRGLHWPPKLQPPLSRLFSQLAPIPSNSVSLPVSIAGGNVTGVTFFINALGAKRLELLRELVPSATVIGFLINAGNPTTESQTRDVQAAAGKLGVELLILNASSERDIDAAFAKFLQQRVNAVMVGVDSFFTSRRDQLVGLAARHALPAIYFLREFADIGGLISYGASVTDAYRLAGGYAGRILKGEKPADLPVQQTVKFELAVNLKTAKALGLQIPDKLLVAADEVIE